MPTLDHINVSNSSIITASSCDVRVEVNEDETKVYSYVDQEALGSSTSGHMFTLGTGTSPMPRPGSAEATGILLGLSLFSSRNPNQNAQM